MADVAAKFNEAEIVPKIIPNPPTKTFGVSQTFIKFLVILFISI